jgi:hypothetical protein
MYKIKFFLRKYEHIFLSSFFLFSLMALKDKKIGRFLIFFFDNLRFSGSALFSLYLSKWQAQTKIVRTAILVFFFLSFFLTLFLFSVCQSSKNVCDNCSETIYNWMGWNSKTQAFWEILDLKEKNKIPSRNKK